jgi:hypothetical protein
VPLASQPPQEKRILTQYVARWGTHVISGPDFNSRLPPDMISFIIDYNDLLSIYFVYCYISLMAAQHRADVVMYNPVG